jgi:hypothetical protein
MNAMLLTTLIWSASPVADSAAALIKKTFANDAMGWTEAHVFLRLTITDRKGKVRIRGLEIRGATLDKRTHTLVRFTEPAELAGTALLLRQERDGSTTQLLYQPAYDKVRPIAAASKQDRFMGTDFSYADFERRDPDEAVYRFLPDAACGKAICSVVEARAPKDLLKGGFERIEFEVHPKALVALRSRFYDPGTKTATKSMTVNRLRKHQGRYVVFAATMKDLKRGSKTRIDILSIDYKRSFSFADFSESALRGQ